MFAFEQDVPIDVTVYEKIIARLAERTGGAAAEGAILHIAIEREDGTLSYLDLWESEADCDRFTERDLHPVVGQALAEAGIRPDREPERRQVKVVDVWGPAFPREAAV
jgi:hypothetical protein